MLHSPDDILLPFLGGRGGGHNVLAGSRKSRTTWIQASLGAVLVRSLGLRAVRHTEIWYYMRESSAMPSPRA